MSHKKVSRRTFIENLGLGCAHLGATSLLSGITNMGLMNSAAAANRPFIAGPNQMDYKALVCIYLAGGNDSFNMLVPLDDEPYLDYAASRTNIAIPQEDLLPINPQNTGGKRFGLHPNLSKLQSHFENGTVAFVANCGVLQQPTSIETFDSGTNLPIGLFSHSHQTDRWQTSIPMDATQNIGWGGRLADVLRQNNSNDNISLNISLSGTNTFQRGNTVQSYTIKNSNNGSTLINGAQNNGFYQQLKRATLDDILEVNHQNILKQAYSDVVTGSKDSSFEFDAAIAGANAISTTFPEGRFANDLKMVARVMAARTTLDMLNQSFFISLGGFDNHDNNLEDHGELMRTLDDALDAFYNAIIELGLVNNVTLFTMSDFGRKLITNGDGTDHAWGGHTMVMGGPVNGQNIYGEYPDVYLDSPLDTGGGRFIPTTSADEYFAELALWFGASSSDLEYILPNIRNFWDPNSGAAPLGFLS